MWQRHHGRTRRAFGRRIDVAPLTRRCRVSARRANSPARWRTVFGVAEIECQGTMRYAQVGKDIAVTVGALDVNKGEAVSVQENPRAC